MLRAPISLCMCVAKVFAYIRTTTHFGFSPAERRKEAYIPGKMSPHYGLQIGIFLGNLSFYYH